MQTWIYSPLQRIASDSGREGGREGGVEEERERDEESSQGWAENGVKRKEQAWLEDHQTRCLIKSAAREVLSC